MAFSGDIENILLSIQGFLIPRISLKTYLKNNREIAMEILVELILY